MYDRKLRIPVFLDRLPEDQWPDPSKAGRDGLAAIGGDLSLSRLLSAYAHGFFPCYGDDTPRLWWCPDPRAIFRGGDFRASRRLARKLRQGGVEVTWDAAFRRVVDECAVGREDGRWILAEIADAFELLHSKGHAHSLEVWRGEALIGGVYGVHLGALFAAESMFHRESDGSKIALAWLLESLFAAGIELVDAQYLTPHLASLGAKTVPRADYLAALPSLVGRAVDLRAIALKPPR